MIQSMTIETKRIPKNDEELDRQREAERAWKQ